MSLERMLLRHGPSLSEPSESLRKDDLNNEVVTGSSTSEGP